MIIIIISKRETGLQDLFLVAVNHRMDYKATIAKKLSLG